MTIEHDALHECWRVSFACTSDIAGKVDTLELNSEKTRLSTVLEVLEGGGGMIWPWDSATPTDGLERAVDDMRFSLMGNLTNCAEVQRSDRKQHVRDHLGASALTQAYFDVFPLRHELAQDPTDEDLLRKALLLNTNGAVATLNGNHVGGYTTLGRAFTETLENALCSEPSELKFKATLEGFMEMAPAAFRDSLWVARSIVTGNSQDEEVLHYFRTVSSSPEWLEEWRPDSYHWDVLNGALEIYLRDQYETHHENCSEAALELAGEAGHDDVDVAGMVEGHMKHHRNVVQRAQAVINAMRNQITLTSQVANRSGADGATAHRRTAELQRL